MACSYRDTPLDVNRLNLMAIVCGESCELRCRMMKKFTTMLVVCFCISLTTGCINSTESEKETVAPVALNTVPSGAELIEPSVIVDGAASSNPIQPIDDFNTAPVFTDVQMASVDQSGIADTDDSLIGLLATRFILESQQVVPTTGWICSDSIGQNRIYYFYGQGILDSSRNVAIERTLNPNNTHSDISFFWSVIASDAIVMTSANTDDNGMLISSGRQYDVNSIRFGNVETIPTFSAESVLRGKLVCGNYDLS